MPGSAVLFIPYTIPLCFQLDQTLAKLMQASPFGGSCLQASIIQYSCVPLSDLQVLHLWGVNLRLLCLVKEVSK
jgi:hypothetical protein